MEAKYKIGGDFGNRISWSNLNEFEGGELEERTFSVNGHVPNLPRVGDMLMGEFVKSFIKFEFVEVDPCLDPPDMFFGKVKAIEQEMKSEAVMRLGI